MANNIGWGEGAKNNSIGWGNIGTNGFGSIYESSRSGETLLSSSNPFQDATVAYSLRDLDLGVTTNVVRVRRSSDNLEQDFTATQVTDGSLTSFCGAGDGFVNVWYDQTGVYDASQATASNQPKIVSAGALILENTKPAIQFDGANDNLKTVFANPIPNVSAVIVSKTVMGKFILDDNDTVNVNSLVSLDDTTLRLYRSTSNRSAFYTVPTGTLNNQFTASFTSILGNKLKLNVNGGVFLEALENLPLSTLGENIGLTLGSSGSNLGYQLGTTQELIFYDNDQTDNLPLINQNINDHYAIY